MTGFVGGLSLASSSESCDTEPVAGCRGALRVLIESLMNMP